MLNHNNSVFLHVKPLLTFHPISYLLRLVTNLSYVWTLRINKLDEVIKDNAIEGKLE